MGVRVRDFEITLPRVELWKNAKLTRGKTELQGNDAYIFAQEWGIVLVVCAAAVRYIGSGFAAYFTVGWCNSSGKSKYLSLWNDVSTIESLTGNHRSL